MQLVTLIMSDQLSDKLVEISCSEWPILRDMYLHDWPTHMIGYYTVDNYVRWNKIKSDIKQLHIYSLNGDWQQDGTFLVVVSIRIKQANKIIQNLFYTVDSIIPIFLDYY